MLMILLSTRGWSPAAVAQLLGCDACTVRRWVQRSNQQGAAGLQDRPRPGRPRLSGPKLTQRIRGLLAQPRAWTIPRLYQFLGRPAISLTKVPSPNATRRPGPLPVSARSRVWDA
jgi:transposase